MMAGVERFNSVFVKLIKSPPLRIEKDLECVK